ncbi:hypothetical protein DVR12_08425 [Chitinophaga silvatica]|uniref:Uncharacterized protein n=2 Tax=Chitinophaga silvatica TaxID=2282649 RepID=A0A3E1YC76_9BACT|nr:hypothetical protein DVR12_08425 [Chitinophaga silvatica]
MSDSDVIAAIKSRGMDVCGRFGDDQLNRIMAEPAKRQRSLLPVTMATLITIMTVTESKAQLREREHTIMAIPTAKDSVQQRQLPEVVVTGFTPVTPRTFTTGVVCVIEGCTLKKIDYDPMYFSGRKLNKRKRR